jgi:hypothetical protein
VGTLTKVGAGSLPLPATHEGTIAIGVWEERAGSGNQPSG